jgi:hypothetical protein
VRTRAERIGDAVERDLTFAADQTPGQPFDQLFVRNLDIEDGVDLPAEGLHHLAERNGLVHGPREPIEEDTFRRLRAADPLAQHSDRDGVWDQGAARHVFAGSQAQVRFALEVIAEQVARGDVHQPERALQVIRLGPLARSRCAE